MLRAQKAFARITARGCLDPAGGVFSATCFDSVRYAGLRGSILWAGGAPIRLFMKMAQSERIPPRYVFVGLRYQVSGCPVLVRPCGPGRGFWFHLPCPNDYVAAKAGPPDSRPFVCVHSQGPGPIIVPTYGGERLSLGWLPPLEGRAGSSFVP